MAIRRADDTVYTLGLNLSANGNAVAVRGGEYTVIMESAGGTGTIALQMQSPSGVWIDVQMYGAAMRTSTTSMMQAGVLLPAGLVRAAVYGGTVLNLNAFLVGAG